MIDDRELEEIGYIPDPKEYGPYKDPGNSVTNAEILVKLIEMNCDTLFKDEYGDAFAVIKVGDHREVVGMESSKFRQYISKVYYDTHAKVAGTDSTNNAIQLLQAKAKFEGITIPLRIRVAWNDSKKDTIYYDLTDEKYRCVEITREGWSILSSDNSPILFRRYNQTPQLEPSSNYDLHTLDKFLDLANIKDNSTRHLLKVYIIALVIPDIPHPMLQLHGEKGSTKSTLESFIKRIIDPSNPELLTIPYDRKEFVQQVSHNHIVYYDNTKVVPKWLPDEACKVVTGAGITKRKLYTDNEDVVYNFRRCIGFNGININLTESDALDRSILIELQRMKQEDRKPESKVISQFEEMLPQTLGYIFDIVGKSIKIKDSIDVSKLPRMADFALWGEAISQAMGYNPYEFLNIYYENIGRQNVEAIEAHPLAQAIVKLIDQYGNETPDKTKEYTDQTKELLNKLNEIAIEHKIDVDSNLWPKSTSVLSRRLKEIKSNLLEGFGIDIIVDREPKTNTSVITILKMSPMHPVTPELKDGAGKIHNVTGGSDGIGGIKPPEAEMPPVNTTEIRGHNDTSGGIGDSGRNLRDDLAERNNSVTAKLVRLPKSYLR